ncbi:hypothetical protein F4806DRAFT_33630 [Annulohypoxylon nitens]|nr:hypothetical protein F4806DRAFT_33630 [Annulohypoxylon nitens]
MNRPGGLHILHLDGFRIHIFSDEAPGPRIPGSKRVVANLPIAWYFLTASSLNRKSIRYSEYARNPLDQISPTSLAPYAHHPVTIDASRPAFKKVLVLSTDVNMMSIQPPATFRGHTEILIRTYHKSYVHKNVTRRRGCTARIDVLSRLALAILSSPLLKQSGASSLASSTLTMTTSLSLGDMLSDIFLSLIPYPLHTCTVLLDEFVWSSDPPCFARRFLA